jgi:hypothetical protein
MKLEVKVATTKGMTMEWMSTMSSLLGFGIHGIFSVIKLFPQFWWGKFQN